MCSSALSCGSLILNLQLPYRGNRNYIHSADIFQELTNIARTRFARNAFVKSLVLRRQAMRQLRICTRPEPAPVGKFSIHVPGEEMTGWLQEGEEPVLDRVPYDQSRAEEAIIPGQNYAGFAQPVAGYTAFEQMLMLLKVAGGQPGKDAWLCQVDWEVPLREDSPVSVRFVQRFDRFFAFEILQMERIAGAARASLRV